MPTTLSKQRKKNSLAKETAIDQTLALAFALLGAIVGSLIGIIYGYAFSELFKALLQSGPAPSYGYLDSLLASATTNVENWGIAIYSLVFIGLGWLGGLSGLVLTLRVRRE